jgi:NAD-dependent dihydropyrimidine dehydrogenase PreA subunit
MLLLITQPLKQFSQSLILELAVEVGFHVPNTPPALNIWPQWSSGSLCAALFHVIDCLQNTFVPIVYDTHSAHPGPPYSSTSQGTSTNCHHLPLNKCNDQRKQLIVTMSCHDCQDCSFVFACEKSAINANDRSTKFESLNAGTQCQE